jgi:hypothetical protein
MLQFDVDPLQYLLLVRRTIYFYLSGKFNCVMVMVVHVNVLYAFTCLHHITSIFGYTFFPFLYAVVCFITNNTIDTQLYILQVSWHSYVF